MKKSTILSLLLTTASSLPSLLAGGVYGNQQLMANPFMTENYEGWSLGSPWRDNGGSQNQVFDFSPEGPKGFFVAQQNTKDIKTTGDHTKDESFDVNTATLSAIRFNGVYIGKANEGAAAAGLNAKFYIEFDIVTTTGTYRAKSIPVEKPWTLEDKVRLDSNTDYKWEDGEGFGGFAFKDGGIPLSQIKSFEAKYIMEVIGNNSTGNGTVFTTIDNASIEYEVKVP